MDNLRAAIDKRIHRTIHQLQLLMLGWRYDEQAAIGAQESAFASIGLSRADGLAAIERISGSDPDLAKGMDSEHRALFGAIAATQLPNRILEIGTYDGRFTVILGQLFPQAEVITVDLPDDSPLFVESYSRGRAEKRQRFILERDERLARQPNITFRQENSLALTWSNDRFDLVWVDGDHGLPAVAIDIANGLRALTPDGLLVCDDVFINPPAMYRHAPVYGSVGALKALDGYRSAGLVDFALFYKRMNKKANAIAGRRKYLALARNINAAGEPLVGVPLD